MLIIKPNTLFGHVVNVVFILVHAQHLTGFPGTVLHLQVHSTTGCGLCAAREQKFIHIVVWVKIKVMFQGMNRVERRAMVQKEWNLMSLRVCLWESVCESVFKMWYGSFNRTFFLRVQRVSSPLLTFCQKHQVGLWRDEGTFLEEQSVR